MGLINRHHWPSRKPGVLLIAALIAGESRPAIVVIAVTVKTVQVSQGRLRRAAVRSDRGGRAAGSVLSVMEVSLAFLIATTIRNKFIPR
jgi:hypothetical protein